MAVIHEVSGRPVLILGRGHIASRLACIFLSGGYQVRMYDPSRRGLEGAKKFIEANISFYCGNGHVSHEMPRDIGKVIIDDLHAAYDAWLVIDTGSGMPTLASVAIAEINRVAPRDCIIGIQSRLTMSEIDEDRRRNTIITQFSDLPGALMANLLGDNHTGEDVLSQLIGVMTKCGMVSLITEKNPRNPVHNLWRASQSDILFRLAEEPGFAGDYFLAESSQSRGIDGLHMSQNQRDRPTFIHARGIEALGAKCDMKSNNCHCEFQERSRPGTDENYYGCASSKWEGLTTVHPRTIYLLDVGLGANAGKCPTWKAGKILKFHPSSGTLTPIVTGQSLPDGIDVSRSTRQLFWTNMGKSLGEKDGSVCSADLDGMKVRTVLAPGSVYTPKQLVVDDQNGKLYLCDREGLSIHRVNFDGSEHEVLLRTGSVENPLQKSDQTRWCVGIAVDIGRGFIYWSQKGPSKGGKGRIFRAGINIRPDETPATRTDIECLLSDLPEPIDLELDAENQVLYWTDRGEHPTGCSLNATDVSEIVRGSRKVQTLARHFHEPIGLKLEARGSILVTDLGGAVYRIENGEKKVMWRDGGSYTGITFM